jgi:YD repeat-containing protein
MKLRLLLLLGLLSTELFSQSAFETPNFAPKTPEAAAFLKFGEYPVDLSTGVPNISIPIYTIDTKDFKLPIALEYHASGIKVTQEATWVGLGWNLNFGAQIILSVRDDVDEGNPYIDIIPDADALENYWDQHPFEFNGGIAAAQHLDRSRIKDVYSLSSPTANGSFYIRSLAGANPDIVIFPPDAFKVEIPNPSSGRGNLDFIVTDTSGNKYLFSNTTETSVRTMTHDDSYTSAWYVDEIITPNNNNLTFKYQSDIRYDELSKAQHIDVNISEQNCGCGTSNGVPNRTISNVIDDNGAMMTYQKQISEISFNNGFSKVTFTAQAGREDLVNENSYLQKIEVKQLEGGTFITKKGYAFEYSYFHPDNLTTYKGKRLRLDRIASIIDGNAHEFVYSEIALPSKESFERDYFGYYNGYGGTNMIPRHYLSPPYNMYVGDANKNVNPLKIQAGLLKEIHYPTKGWTKFNYEPNQYFGVDKFDKYNTRIVSGCHTVSGFGTPNSPPVIVPQIDETLPAICQDPPSNGCINYGVFPFEAVNATGLLKYQSDVHGQAGPTVMKWKYWRLRIFIDGQPTAVFDTDIQRGSTSGIVSQVVSLPASGYILAEAYGSSVDILPSLSYTNNDPTPKNICGAGVRIQSIENYSHDNILALKKEYDYSDILNSNNSSGKLVNEMSSTFTSNSSSNVNISQCPCILEPCGFYYGANYQGTYRISSDSRYGIEGNSVVYQYVKETAISSLDNTSNGFTLYKFSSDPDEFSWGDPSIQIYMPWKRGKVLEKDIYKSVGNQSYLLTHEINTYVEDPSKIAMINGFKMFKHINLAGVTENEQNPMYPPSPYNLLRGACGVPGNVDAVFEVANLHAAIPWFYLQRTQTNQYFYNSSNIRTGSIDTTNDFYYSNPLHQQLSSQISKNSLGEVIQTKYFYPQDAMSSDPVILAFISKNIITTPLKTTSIKAGHVISESITKFAMDSSTNNLLLPKFVDTSKGNDDPQRRITYDKYDGSGNLLQYTIQGGNPVSIIWGYNNTQPIAKIENMIYDMIPEGLISDAQHSTAAESQEQALIDLNAIRANVALKNAMVTTYTYIPLFGVSAITDPKGITTYYEYDNEGRLVRIKDSDKHIVSENEYHYKN